MIKQWLLIIVVFVISCKSQEQHNSLDTIAEKIGDNAVIDYNPNRSFALVQEKFSLLHQSDYTTNYMIIRMADKKIMHEGKVVQGHVKWVNDDVIEIFEMPGVIKEGQKKDDFKKHININSMKLEKNRNDGKKM